MYQWLVFLHVLGVLGFLTAHGASAAVTFKLRGGGVAVILRLMMFKPF